jgi:hypothetical protein
MPKLPEPPADLSSYPPDRYTISAGTELWRIYARGGAYPRAWNMFRAYVPVADMRFDHHEEPTRDQPRRILYGGSRIPVCVAEFFQKHSMIDRHRGEPWLVGFTLVRDVTVLNLCGIWPTRAGASMALTSGRRDRSRRWSRAIYAAYPDLEGLWYGSSMYGNHLAFALYERAENALAPVPYLHMPLAAPGLSALLSGIARQIGYRFA